MGLPGRWRSVPLHSAFPGFVVKINPGKGSRVQLFNGNEIEVDLEVFGEDGELYEDETCV